MKRKKLPILLIIVLLGISFLTFYSYKLEVKKRAFKTDLVELSNVKYGMFNVDKWKESLANIISKKIKELKLDETNKETARKKIVPFLHTVIQEFENNYKKENQEKSLFGISIKNIGADIFSVFDKLKEEIPSITEGILNFLDEKENRENIKAFILLKLDNYRNQTFQKIDYSTFDNILQKYNATNEKQSRNTIQNEINTVSSKLKINNFFFVIIFVLILGFTIYNQCHSKLTIVFYILVAIHFLILGILLPMIDIDARVSSMEFKLLGETISFKDQVLYFKSKSIIEMARIMLSQGQIKIIFVGILVLVFSVIFPLTKMLFTILYLFKESIKKSKIIRFFVFKSGKWSMADVMVVAIFMSYLGFEGILSNQLSQLEKVTDRLNILTTNNSQLQSGFFFFLGFVIISLVVSQIMSNKTRKETSVPLNK